MKTIANAMAMMDVVRNPQNYCECGKKVWICKHEHNTDERKNRMET